MSIFAGLIVAQQGFIEKFKSLIITLSNGGLIQSENFQEGQSGFRIKHDGDAEFNNGKFRGHIEADSGELNNVTIKEQAVFLGTIKTGPVFISNKTTAAVPAQQFASNTMIRTVVTALGVGTFNLSTGFFGNKQNLISVITTQGVIGNNAPYPIYILKLLFQDGTEIILVATNGAYYGSHTNTSVHNDATIGQILSIGGSVPGKIFIIDSLPIGSAGLSPGTLYRNGNQLCIV